MKVIERKLLPDSYTEMMKTEQHHQHEIIEDEQGALRWKADPFVNELVDALGLNEIVGRFYAGGHDKNSELYRELYRRMGYSLSGYWEIFYWQVNNEDVEDYRPPARA